MALHKIKDFYPDYRNQLDNQDIIGYGLYSGGDKVGSVDDLLVDDDGRFRYLIINTGAWIFGKKVLLPIGRTQIDYGNRHVNVNGLTREQVENLPEYDGSMVDYDYEERVRDVYRPSTAADPLSPGLTDTSLTGVPPITSGTSMGSTPGLGTVDTTRESVYDEDTLAGNRTVGDRTIGDRTIGDRPIGDTPLEGRTFDRNYNRDTYTYDRDPGLFGLNDRDHQNLKLYEERLIADKTRVKTGEVTVGKRVETEKVNVSVPIEKERVVVERVTPTDTSPVAPGTAFSEGEVARMEVYEEVPDIRKEAFVREEVRVRKEVDRDTVEANETVRKERLDIDKDGNPIVQS